MTIKQSETIKALPKTKGNLAAAMRIGGYSEGSVRAGSNYYRLRKITQNLPFLNPTSALWDKEPVRFIDKRGGKHYSTDMYPKTANRGLLRARTFQGIAQAMATQWG